MLGEDREQADDRLVLRLGQHPCLEIHLLQFFHVHLRTPVDELTRGALELGLGRLVQEDLTGLEKGDEVLADADRHGGIAKAGEALERGRLQLGLVLDLALELKAGGAALVRLGDEGAEGIFLGIAVVRPVKGVDGAQAERQAGRLAKGLFIIAIDLRRAQLSHEGLAVFGRARRFHHGQNR